MKGMLRLLAVFLLLARCQQKPQVSVSPELKKIFTGDLIFLKCNSGGVRWYFNDLSQTLTKDTWKIGVASPKHSGVYKCESNGEKSEPVTIDVLDYVPTASLTIKTGQPVVRKGDSVVLQLDNEDGLQGWKCWVYNGAQTQEVWIWKKQRSSVTWFFQPRGLTAPESIFWCTSGLQRSNQIILRTSEKAVSLEIFPLPAVTGEALTLRCLVWGTDKTSRIVFYKNDLVIEESLRSYYNIPGKNVSESAYGSYKCHATYTYKERTAGPSSQVMSDNQEVFVQTHPVKAVLSVSSFMSCSCPRCPRSSHRWYYRKNHASWGLIESNKGTIVPQASGSYACRAVWDTGRSSLSNAHYYQPPIMGILFGVIGVLFILVLAAIGMYLLLRRRRDSGDFGPTYEDLPLTSQQKADDKTLGMEGATGGEGGYEALKKKEMKDGVYHTLGGEGVTGDTVGGEGGGYEALKKRDMKEGVYHTLGMEGATGGEGGVGYEALKKREMKEGVYHTLGMEGATGGGEGGGYEALKKREMKEGVYHTLGMEGATGGEGGGGYEALKKREMKEGVYHTLGMEGATGGEGGGGYEALKKREMKEGVYHTLGMEGQQEIQEEEGMKH